MDAEAKGQDARDLHERLVARQDTGELKRKARKANRRAIWTQEDVDWWHSLVRRGGMDAKGGE